MAFLATAAAALWLGWNVYVVEQRRSVMRSLGPYPASSSRPVPADFSYLRADADDVVQVFRQIRFISKRSSYFPPSSAVSLPWLRRQLGDEAYLIIYTRRAGAIDQLRRWFPEAVCVLEPPLGDRVEELNCFSSP
jgi:hypothetical protein